MKLKEVIFVLAIIFMVFLFIFIIKYSGFAIQNTTSRVNIDNGIIVLADEFDGSTTNFLYMNDSKLGEIENMTLEKVSYGKIIFNEVINLTKNVKDNHTNLDNNVNISFNRIEINTTELTSLEKSATLYFYGLTFSNPRILKNGEICTSCQIIGYPSGTLVFNVSNFSVYSAEETPSEAIISVVGAGGGGLTKVSDFSLDKDYIKVSLKQEEIKRETIKLTNTGQNILNFTIKPELIGRFTAISEDSFSLKPGESKTLNIDIFAKENEIPDAYIGRIIIKGGEVTKSVNVIVEVKEKIPFFDISEEVVSKEVNAGGRVEADINIVNKGDLKNIDVSLYYAVKDFQQNVLSFKEEKIFVKDELNIRRRLRIPVNAPFGAYVFYSKVSYGNISAVSTDMFMVSNKTNLLNFILIVFIIVLIIMICILKRKNKKR